MGTTLTPLPPGQTIGILGGGQLGRMLAMAAAKLGLKVHIYTDEENSPAAEVADRTTLARYDDEAALTRFAQDVSVVTYEFENVPVATAQFLERVVPVRPGSSALAVAQDRLREKQFMRDNAIPVAPFAAVNDTASLQAAVAEIGLPAILKTRVLGYDGKGQVRLRDDQAIATACDALANAPAILEGFIPFTSEFSVIAVRGLSAAAGTDSAPVAAFYDCPQNSHENGVLRRSVVPAPIDAETVAEACRIAALILEKLDYVGVLGVEFFHLANHAQGHPSLLVNEIAPRVHNSGHWTMDACTTGQFENHIRAVAGWPLGPTTRHSDVEMENLIGSEIHAWHALLTAEPGASLHVYGKAEARPGRKMGHINRLRPRSEAKSGG